jgi:multidrug efflux pump subunit AcrB
LTAEEGSNLLLGDLATIRDGFEETGFHSRFDDTPSVELEVFRVGEQSPLEVSAAVRQTLDAFAAELPPGLATRIDSSAARDFEQRLSLLLENGLTAVLIVLGILSLFLEVRLAFWVMVGMVISFVGGLAVLPWIGVSINMISMFAFIVVLGIVVDDAIVVGENVHEHRRRGAGPLEAAVRGVREMARPVTFSILTNVIAFLPLLFLPGTTGKFWWPLSAVVIVVLELSLFEALFILPAHLGHGATRRRPLFGRLHRLQQAVAGAFDRFTQGAFRGLLGACLRQRYVTLSAALGLLLVVGAWGASGHMGLILMPEVPADEIEAGVQLPVGTTTDQAARVASAVTDATRRMLEEHDLHRTAEGVKTNVRNQNFIDVEIVMKPPTERTMSGTEVIELWRDQIGDLPGVDQISFEAESGPGGWRQDISIDLAHEDVDVLEAASRDFVATVSGLAATRDVNDNFERGKRQFDVRLRPEGRALGLTPEGLGRQVRNAFFGALALRHLRGTNEVEVRVKLPRAERERLETFDDYVVRTPGGAEVPLQDVAEIDPGEAFQTIERRGGRRVVTVGMDVEPKSAIGRVIATIRDEELPALRSDHPGLTWSFEGSQADMRESTRALWGGFAIALVVIYALLAVAFGSYSQPLVVMAAIPFGIIGAVIGHILLGYDLSLISLMGVIALAGVVVNDSLIMIDHANRHRGEHSAFDAIREAGVRRFRPIVLTTLTTFGGLTPIILESSRQAAYLVPMAISLGFGIVFATGIILLLVPSLYLALEDLHALGADRA